MGPQEDYIETVVTCEGDFHDPQLQDRLRCFQQRLESLLLEDGKKQLILKKVEPWNSVRVTFNIPREAALRLKQLAEQGNASLRQIGVLGVQIEGDRLVSLTVATPNNQQAELILRTHDGGGQGAASGASQSTQAGASISFDPGLLSSSDELGSPGPSMEVTRKNIEEYLRQGSIFNSILAPASGAGPTGAGPSSDIFKTPSSADGPAFRPNNITAEGMPGPSGQVGFPARSPFPGGHGPGAFAPPLGQRGPRMSVTHHPPQHHQQHQQQQLPSQATALPQTAALGYTMNLPPPPPYPHGHGAGVVNNVGRQGKKTTASSPLLINLLQTDPLAGANSMVAPATGEKPKKKRKRSEKKRQIKSAAAATDTSDGQLTGPGLNTLPLDSTPTSSVVPLQPVPPVGETDAVLAMNRQVSPIPLPSPRLSAGFNSSVPAATDHGVASESFRDRNPSTASAALASLAQSQRSTVEFEQFSGDAIINPYTGHMEPRDSASDLSPVKKDQHKAHGDSVTDNSRIETPVSAANPSTSVSVSAAKTDARTGSSDSAHLGLSSFHLGTTVPSGVREERPRGFPSSTVTSMSVPAQTHSVASDPQLGQRPDLSHSRVTTVPSTSSISAAPHIYAPHPFGPSQPSSRASGAAAQHSSPAHLARVPTVNGPVSVPSSLTVSLGQTAGLESRSQVTRVSLEGANLTPYHMPSLRPQPSVRSDVLHNVSVGSEVRLGGGGHVTDDSTSHQPGTVGNTQPVTHKTVPVADRRQGPAPTTTATTQAQSDSLKLLNSSPTLGAVQRVSAESTTATNTTSPSGSKLPSDGDDNSNHSGISPVSQTDGATAPASLLDTNGTKVDNHDSGVGSSSERSEDTTPSEVGDGEFQTSVATTEPSSSDSNGSKPVVGAQKGLVNCKKETTSSADPQTITVGYVQVNQHTTELYNKETKKHIAESPLIGEKASVEETLRQVPHLIKSTSGLTPIANQMALAADKEMEVSLSLPSKANSPQQQRLLMKHKTAPGGQIPGIHQNGPVSVAPGEHHQHPQGLRLTNSHGAVHHPTGITISHSQGHVGLHHPPSSQGLHHPPSSTPNSQGVHHPPSSAHNNQNPHHQPGGVPVSQALHHHPPGTVPVSHGLHHPSGGAPLNQTLHHLPGSTPNSQGYVGLHHPPSSVASSLGQSGIHSGTPAMHGHTLGNSLQPGAAVSQGTETVTSVTSHSSVHSLHGVGVSSSGGVVHGVSSAAPSSNQGQRTAGVSLPLSVAHSHHSSGSMATHSHLGAVTLHNQVHNIRRHGLSPLVSGGSAAQGHGGLHHPSHPGPLGQHSHSHPSHGPPSHNPPSSSGLSQNAGQIHCTAEKLARTTPSPLVTATPTVADVKAIPSPLVTAAPTVLEAAPAHTLASAVPYPHNSKGSGGQPVSNAHNTFMGNCLMSSANAELAGKGQPTYTTAASAFGTSEGGLLSNPVKQSSPRLSSHKSPGNDLGSVAADLVSSGAVSELDLMEADFSHNDDAVFDPDDDLTLLNEPGLSAYLDMGIRHGTTNGSGGIGTEARGGSNITSMYTKRSSPINVNMLNHMYAAGLPQPRRLTESVQRLVKPLPTQENSLPAGRTCKSPGASSRHSSNGSTSPGRASQGGARSPGANVSVAPVSRNMSFDKLTSSQPSSISNSSVGGVGSFPPAFHTGQSGLGSATFNCVNTSVIPAAPHPLALLQSSASSRPKAGSGPASLSSSPVSQASSVTSAFASSGASAVVTLSSSAFASASSSSLSSLSTMLAVTSQAAADMLVSSHLSGDTGTPSHDYVPPASQLPAHNHSMGGSPSPAPLLPSNSLPSVTCSPVGLSPHLPLPALVQPQPLSRVSSPAVPASSGMPGGGPSLSNHVPGIRLPHHALPPHPHPHSQQLPVSVCNTSRVDSVHGSGGSHPPLTLSSPFSSSSAAFPPRASLSSPSLCPTSAIQQHQQWGIAVSSVAPTVNASCAAATVSSSLDLGTRTTVASAGQSPHLSVASSCMCVSTVSAAFTPGPTHVMSKPVTASQPLLTDGHQSGAASSPGSARSEGSANPMAKTEHSRQPLTHRHSPVLSSHLDSQTRVTSSGMTLPLSESSQTVLDSGGLAVIVASSGVGGDPATRPPSQSSASVSTDLSVPKLNSTVESGSQPPVLKESMEKEEGGVSQAAASSVPSLSHHGVHDAAQNSHTGLVENLHSKPPLLHPTPPLILPTPLPSATPPPPPLTPVLPQDPLRKEMAANPGQSTPPLTTDPEGQVEFGMSFLRDMPRTASPLALIAGPTAVDSSDKTDSDNVGNMSKAADAAESQIEAAVNCCVPSSEPDEPKPLVGEPISADASSEENSLKARRFTRKRKSTHSESDSSSEPAPKLSCMESMSGSGKGAETSKSSTASDHPPKLHREGKRSHSTDKKDEEKAGKEEKGGRKEDEKDGKKEEEKGGKKEEDKGGKKEDKSGLKGATTHHDRNILDATPEEVARKMAAVTTGGKRRVHYAYVPEKSLTSQSYFDTPVLSGRTRSQGTKGHREGPSAASGTVAAHAPSAPVPNQPAALQPAVVNKEDAGDAAAGSKRSTRSLRTKDAGESGQGKRKRVKEHR